LAASETKLSLRCTLGAGLSNQENMVENCLRAASISGRALVMPRPLLSADTPLVITTKASHFGALWSVANLRHYSARMWNVSLLMSEPSPDVSIQGFYSGSTRPCSLGGASRWRVHWPRGGRGGTLSNRTEFAATPQDRGAREVLLRRLLLSSDVAAAPVVELVSPFCAVTCPTVRAGAGCCHPSPDIEDHVARFAATHLRGAYSCLHARVELDWFRMCCDAAPESAMGEHGSSRSLGADATPREADGRCEFSGTPPPAGCFVSPASIAGVLRESGLPAGGALFVASGASAAALEPLSRVFKVRRLPAVGCQAERSGAANYSVFASYTQALAERMLCANASRFFGVDGSSFTKSIAALRFPRHGTCPRAERMNATGRDHGGGSLCKRVVQYYGACGPPCVRAAHRHDALH
jgi:hypothetical protein